MRSLADFKKEIDGLLAGGADPRGIADWFSPDDLAEFITAYAMERAALLEGRKRDGL